MFKDVKRDFDNHMSQLNRLLLITRKKEEEFDFPVAFVSNFLYVCYKNKMSHIVDLEPFLDLLVKKVEFLHLEGLAHVAYALNEAGIRQGPVWDKIHEQILKKDTFQLIMVKNMNFTPSDFEYVGKKGGKLARTNEFIMRRMFEPEIFDFI